MEYTGIRRTDAFCEGLHSAFDSRRCCPNGLVTVNFDDGDEECIIDPHLCGNDLKYPNHSCDPNCILMTVPVIDRYIVMVLALRPVKAGTDVTV